MYIHLLSSRRFIVYVFKNATPNFRAAKTIQTSTLMTYRNSLLYWITFIFDKREKSWSRWKAFNAMTKAMNYVAKTYGGPWVPRPKTWLGLAELRQLLDYEAANNKCIELLEQHQVRPPYISFTLSCL